VTKIAVVYYSATGTNYAMANAVAEGAREAGAEVRVRIVEETVPAEIRERNPAWAEFAEKTKDDPKASHDDLEWADGVIFGTPTRYGNVAAQLKAFIDSTGGLWAKGKLADKVYAGFTSAQNPHGGQESTLLALFNTIYHYGGIIATTGYTDPVTFKSGGNPYGPSVTAGDSGPTDGDLAHARYLGKRVAEVAGRLAG
jgi:NAD(P)H dehydrogenase (quinone)